MNMSSPFVVAIVALVGVALGAIIGHFSAIEQQEQSKLLELRSSAYLLFLRGQAALQESKQQSNLEKAEELESQYRQAVKEARFQIGILGSGDEVNALAEYFLLNPPGVICTATWAVDVEIYKAMRRDLIPRKKEAEVDDARLYYLLWGNCLPPPLAGRDAKLRE
ncbi:MAG: hypothetical protein C4528_07395 [Gammaproteobacteria bacterium]|nr:MAG: hypothetical protein C4528_07395 [Gammaproteobacteria bacterium]